MFEQTPLVLLALGVALAVGTMLGAWALHRRLRNAGIVDVAWTLLVGALAALAAAAGDGWLQRRWAIGLVTVVWSARLGLYLLGDRILGRDEDARYATLRRGWGARAGWRFFWFFQAQALAALLFALPAFLATSNTEPAWHPFERVALALWVIAFCGELLADRQLARFKADPASRGRTCRSGLWRYSRHPNYFFEWLTWMAYALFALPSAWGWLAFICPAVMLYLLFRVTGIPATEAQALRSRGDDYRRYQQTTSAFIPWIPRP